MRNRAKEILPNVLLTLLSIIQALALELLWSKVQAADYLFDGSWLSLIFWLQILSTFMGILVIWVVYTTNVMRFRWVPGISDSVLPFFVGIAQFSMIEVLGPGSTGWWFIFLAIIFGLMHGIVHMTMRRARLDGDNDDFFRTVSPATIRDIYPPAAMVLGVAAFGAYLLYRPEGHGVAGVGMGGALTLLGYHLHSMAYFWNRAMSDSREAAANQRRKAGSDN